MTKIIDKEIVPVMLGTKCDGCRERIVGGGIHLGQLDNGKQVYYCQKCYLESKIHPR